MASTVIDPKQQAHELIDRMAPGQVAAVVGVLEIILDPLARALAKAPYDDEPVDAEPGDGGTTVPHDDVLKEFGLTGEDFERMGRRPLEPHGASR